MRGEREGCLGGCRCCILEFPCEIQKVRVVKAHFSFAGTLALIYRGFITTLIQHSNSLFFFPLPPISSCTVKAAWDALRTDTLKELTATMLHGRQAVIDANGMHTVYRVSKLKTHQIQYNTMCTEYSGAILRKNVPLTTVRSTEYK